MRLTISRDAPMLAAISCWVRRSVAMRPSSRCTACSPMNFSNRQVGEVLGKSEGAVKALTHRALLSLRKKLEKQQDLEKQEDHQQQDLRKSMDEDLDEN